MNPIRKGLAVAIIILFLGLSLAPSINANTQSDFVDFTTEVCGLNGGKQAIKLTQQQADEVEALFDSIREQLNATESREEAEEIFKDAVVELDKYGMLGSLSVKQALKAVTGEWIVPSLLRFIKLNHYSNNMESWEPDVINYFCLFTAFTIDAFEINIWGLIASTIGNLYFKFPFNVLYLLVSFFIEFGRIKPLRLLNQIDIGVGVAWSYSTFGLFGKRNGSYDFHTADGFSDFKIISNQESREAYYLGFALRVTEKPFL